MSPTCREGAGEGLVWVLLVLVTVGDRAGGSTFGRPPSLSLVGDRCIRRRAPWTFVAVKRQPTRSIAGRQSTWPGNGPHLGFVYLLLHNLPRTRNESSILAGALRGHGRGRLGLWSVSGQGRASGASGQFKRNPKQMLQKLNITPGTRGELMLRNRLPAVRPSRGRRSHWPTRWQAISPGRW